MRLGLFERARGYGRPVVAVRFLPGLDVCQARNATCEGTGRRVPDEVLVWQYDLAARATEAVLLAEEFTVVLHADG